MKKNEIAILMAAGLGIRMRPLTTTTPKPLIKVHGKPMIETVIDGLKERGVEQIVIVVGYLGGQFGYLENKYKGLQIVENTEYQTMNNISSVYAAREYIGQSDCFICEADLYIPSGSIFQTELTQSCYFGKMVYGYSDDWVFEHDETGRITRVGKGGTDCYNMVGISYLKKEDAKIIIEAICEAYRYPGHEELFWDEIVDHELHNINLTIHPIEDEQIVEIDTVEELEAVIDGI